MLTMLLYVLIVGLVTALLFLAASAVFGRGEELGPLPEGTTETVLPAENISGADVRELRFQQVARGYKAGEVDWALARLAARIDELEGQLARARGESSQPGPAVERTGPGTTQTPTPWNSPLSSAVLWPGGPHQHAAGPHQHAPTPHDPNSQERTVRTERQDTSGDAGTVRTERHGTSGDTRPGNDDAQAALHTASSPHSDTPAPQPSAPQPATGPIPWSGLTETGPWEAPTSDGNSAGPDTSTSSYEPYSWTGPFPRTPAGSPHTGAPSPDGVLSGPPTGTYAPVPEVSRAEEPGLPSSLNLPPITATPNGSRFTQPPAPPTGATTRWPDTSSTAKPGAGTVES
jgi:DivIVA domain-containing protein